MSPLNGNTKVYGVVGHPVEHSFSPFLHNLLAEKVGLNMVYVPFPVKPEAFDHYIASLKTLEVAGCNVTIPYKVDVMAQLDVIDNQAKRIGAVNTVHFKQGKTYGYNTDLDGLLIACQKKGIAFKDAHVLMIGAGGAAKSVAVMCVQEGVSKITLINRTKSKSLALGSLIERISKGAVCVEVLDALNAERLEGCQLAFQTTSIGMYPNVDATPIEHPDWLSKLDFAVDIIYNPTETKFLRDLRLRGVKTLNGLDMLYYQGVKAFEIWHNSHLEEKIVEDVHQAFVAYMQPS